MVKAEVKKIKSLRRFKPKWLEEQRFLRGPPTLLFVGGRGTGKCLEKGTEVFMYDGTIKKVEEIQIDDLVMGDDSTPRRVLDTFSGIGELYKVHQNNSKDYVVNGEHTLSLYVASTNSVTNDKPCMIEIQGKKYLKGDIVDINVENYCKLSKTTRSARLKGYRCKVEFKERKIDYTGELNNYVYIKGVKFAKDPNIEIDTSLYINTESIRKSFLSGLVDVHAHHSGDSKSLEFCKVDNRILKIAAFVGRTLGYLCNFTFSDNRLIMSSPELYKLGNKYPVNEYKYTKNYMITGINVTPIGEGQFYGFDLDGNHRFLLEDCTVTHNSHVCKEIIRSLRKIPSGIVMSGTQQGREEFSISVPSTFVYDGVRMDVIKKLTAKQRKTMKSAPKRKDRTTDLDTLLLLEDCMAEKQSFTKPEMRDIFMNGRHLGICFVMTMQYCMDIPPSLRSQIDYVFATREFKVNSKKKLYENFFGCFESFAQFDRVFSHVTKDHGVLVMDTTNTSGIVKDMIFSYKAPSEVKPFKFGNRAFWNLHEEVKKAKKAKKKLKSRPVVYNPDIIEVP
jgi:hypothetical protein